MGCGCGKGSTFTPPTREQAEAADAAALAAAKPIVRGRLAPGFTWNGPQPASK